MHSYNKKKLAAVMLALAVLTAFFNTKIDKYLYFNTSSSIPKGVYYRTSDSPENISVGDIVVFEPSKKILDYAHQREYMPQDVIYMMKYVGSTDGDTVSSGDNFTVGDRSYGKIMKNDSKGRKLVPYSEKDYTVKDDEFIAYGTHPRSFDSRFYGPIPKENIICRVKPLLLFGSEQHNGVRKFLFRKLQGILPECIADD